jgi:hypothetical protein
LCLAAARQRFELRFALAGIRAEAAATHCPGIQRGAPRVAYVRRARDVRHVGHTGRPRRVETAAVGAHARGQCDPGAKPMIAGFTIHNFLLVGVLAVLFILAFKGVASRLNIGGLKAIAQNI